MLCYVMDAPNRHEVLLTLLRVATKGGNAKYLTLKYGEIL